MIVATPTFHFDGRHFNKLKKTAAANCSLFYKCIYALWVVLLCILHRLHFVLPEHYASCCSCHVHCGLCYSALCCSCNSELGELGLRRCDVAWAEQRPCESMSTCLRERERKVERVRVNQNEREWQWQSEPEIEPEWVSCREKLNYGTFCHIHAVYALWTKRNEKIV